MENPDITITLLTYNHKKYIASCLDGIINQKTTCSIEVLVGDDASTDGTQELLREYDRRYPGFFKLILREKNIGATKNLYDLLRKAKGKYIAGLEGDDYWIDEGKLQKQFEFLETHKNYIGCSHEVKVVDENGRQWCFDGKYVKGRHWSFYKEIYTYEDYQQFILPGQGSTYLYRNVFKNPQYDYSIIEKANPLIGDMTLMLILSSQGDWYYMQGEAMTCYRYIIDGNESWASRTKNTNTTYEDYIYRDKLEKYAKHELKKKLDLSKTKDEMIVGAFRRMMNSSSKVDEEIYKKIKKHSSHSALYFIKLHFQFFIDEKTMQSVVYAIQSGEIDSTYTKLSKSTWKDFDKAIKGKTIVAFGRGGCFWEFLKKYGKRYSVPIVLDNNPKYAGTLFEEWNNPWKAADGEYEFAEVCSPEEILSWDKKKFVILITSTLYQDQIAKQLDELGFSDYFSVGPMEQKRALYRKYKKNPKSE